jgi:cytochrome-b5 reductase
VTIVPLIAKRRISHDVRVFTFGLPDRNRPLNLATCACILAVGAADGEGQPVVRPYTPVSTNAQVGSFDLMVKIYPGGIMSSFLDTLTKNPLAWFAVGLGVYVAVKDRRGR